MSDANSEDLAKKVAALQAQQDRNDDAWRETLNKIELAHQRHHIILFGSKELRHKGVAELLDELLGRVKEIEDERKRERNLLRGAVIAAGINLTLTGGGIAALLNLLSS